jgi:hypothetical protein
MPYKVYGVYSKLHKTGCIVCGAKGVWSGEKLGKHRICLSCKKLGYHFSSTQPVSWNYRAAMVLDRDLNILGEVRIRC